MAATRLTLPIPPSVNQMYSNVLGRGRIATTALRNWKEAAGLRLKEQRPQPVIGPYKFALYLPNKMRGDIDGRLKAAIDLLVTHGVTPDDRFAKSVLAERCEEVEAGQCVIVVDAI